MRIVFAAVEPQNGRKIREAGQVRKQYRTTPEPSQNLIVPSGVKREVLGKNIQSSDRYQSGRGAVVEKASAVDIKGAVTPARNKGKGVSREQKVKRPFIEHTSLLPSFKR
jgi:hypothetical protein